MRKSPLARGSSSLRRSPMARGASTLARTPMKSSNPGRKAKTFKRVYGSAERAQAIKAMRCLVPSCLQTTPSENAHVPSKSGAGRKGDACHNVPLCRWHHTQSLYESLHDLGKAKFNAYHGVDLDAEAAKIEKMFPTTETP